MSDDTNNQEQYVRQSYTELNPLTGLYYNRAFFKKTNELLNNSHIGTYALVAVDIAHFRIFNKSYGRETGDQLLIYIADCVKKVQDLYHGIAGYLGGDNFCVLMPDNIDTIKQLESDILEGFQKYNNLVEFYPVFGVYSITDPSEPAATMYDCATIALSNTAGKYANRICWYDRGLEEQIEEELKLLSEIQTGLKEEEFTFFAQPQCDISTGKIVGAESLVRWNHKTKGLIPPGVFIPILEKNGMISELDRYVWKKVCQWLRSWIDKGYHPVPMSINVSRVDILSMDVLSYLKYLLNQYHLPEKLLKIEITESAYSENNDKIINIVNDMRTAGFTVMMDDFGSGYSSLNMLKHISVDVLKLDMRFLDIDEQEKEKGIGILESVVNMAKMMGLPVIVEGVETQTQENFLLELGCRYIQGYYYYKPLPITQFEELLSDERRLDFNGLCCKQVESMHIRELLDTNVFNDAMINNMLGATAFYEIYENQITITRVNEQYCRLTGICPDKVNEYDNKLGNHVRDDDKNLLFSIFDESYENPEKGAHGNAHYLCANGDVLWVYIRVFFLRERDGHKLFCGSLVDMTEIHRQKKESLIAAQEVNELTEKQQLRLEKYFGNMPYGYCIVKILLDDTKQPNGYEFLYMNQEIEKLCGSNFDRLRTLLSQTFAHNYDDLVEKGYRAAFLGKTEDLYTYSAISNRYLQLTLYQYEYGYVGCILRDVTHMHMYEDALKTIMQAYREVYFIELQDNYFRMIYPEENSKIERGNYEESINRHFGSGKIIRSDEQNIRRFLSLDNLRDKLMTQDSIEYRYLRTAPDGGQEWCITTFTVSTRENGVPKTVLVTIRSIEAFLQEEEEQRRENMAKTLANMSDGFLIYQADDKETILYANPKVVEIYGCDTLEEFLTLVDHSFHGMVHPEDYNRIKWEINDQIEQSDDNMDFIQYRIIRKDGSVRWIDDCGHLEDSNSGSDNPLFYVFISDITDSMDEQKKEKLLNINRHY